MKSTNALIACDQKDVETINTQIAGNFIFIDDLYISLYSWYHISLEEHVKLWPPKDVPSPGHHSLPPHCFFLRLSPKNRQVQVLLSKAVGPVRMGRPTWLVLYMILKTK